MGNVLLENLQSEIEAGNVIAVIGAGVSIGATINQPAASWQGLLHNGVNFRVPTTEAAIRDLPHNYSGT